VSTPMFAIGGLGSGLDTQGIIAQLLQVERQPIVRFQQRQADLRAVDQAWGSLVARLSGLRTAADNLRLPTRIAEQVAVTSSAPDVVTATRSGVPSPGSISFSVERLATAHQIVTGTSPLPTSDAGVGSGTFTLLAGDGAPLVTVSTDETTTLSGLAAAINRGQRAVSAQVVRTGEGAFRLVLTARETGEANRFSVDTDLAGFGQSAEGVTLGQDALLRVGTLDVTRSSNTVTDLLPGVTLGLRAAEPGRVVTVGVEQDIAEQVKQVKGFVDALNSALGTLKEISAPGGTRPGPLSGDSLVRRIAAELRSAVGGVVEGLQGTLTTAGSVGISLQRDGTYRLDETRLRELLAEDPEAVQRLVARTGETTDARVRFTAASERTAAGAHAVEVTRAARVAMATGAAWTPPSGDPRTFSITMANGRRVDVVIDADTDVGTAVARINAALRAASITGVTASEQDGALRLTGTVHGSAQGFTVSGTGDPALDGMHRGEDVAGTIAGVAATGTGQTLAGTEGAAEGLRLRVLATPAEVDAAGGALDLGSVTVTQGLAGRVDAVLRDALGAGGSVARAREDATAQIRRFDARIAAFEDRLLVREKALRARFTAMERAMAQLASQGSWMAAQISSMSVGQQP
jgi:flagellar hook-associated protein 2